MYGRSIKFFLSFNWIYQTDEEYILLKMLENNHKCVALGLPATIINVLFNIAINLFYH